MSEMYKKMQAGNQAPVDAGDVQEPEEKQMVLELADCNLVDVVKDVTKIFAASPLGLRAKVNCRSMVDEMLASIDREKIVEVMNILLGNSVKFSPGDCQISVNLGRGEGDRAIIQIADNSIGIKDEFKATAFEPMVGSEGIGLDKVKDIVVAHGGSVRLEDNPGGGTIFFISLPVHPEVEVVEAEVME